MGTVLLLLSKPLIPSLPPLTFAKVRIFLLKKEKNSSELCADESGNLKRLNNSSGPDASRPKKRSNKVRLTECQLGTH